MQMISTTSKKVKVLIVDDSALIRAVLSKIIDSDDRMEVVAVAQDAFEARELIKLHSPDVLTLDIEMPKMNGITFLKNLMRLRPMPVVMISTLTHEGAPLTLEALAIGAVDFLPKPNSQTYGGLESYQDEILEKIYCASSARVKALQDRPSVTKAAKPQAQVSVGRLKDRFLVAIGASTGGTEALKEVISAMPENSPPMVVVQHIPAAFSSSYARRVDACSAMKVFEAEHGQTIKPGCVYIAPGDFHLSVDVRGREYVCSLNQHDPVNRHRPSVEVLYDSVLASTQSNCMGVLLTGMGADGSEALLRMRQAGCMTIAQDEDSSVVWGMPGMAVKLGGAAKVLPLRDVAQHILISSSKASRSA